MGSWQDDVRGALDGLRYGARSALSPRVLQGAAVEIGWFTTHLAMYPSDWSADPALVPND
jgi:hypothetical protein